MIAWIFALMLLLAPPERIAALPAFPGWAETGAARRARYLEIAKAIAAASRTTDDAADLVAVSFHESVWAPDVDIGPCYRGKTGRGPRCDAGRAVSIWQIHASGEHASALQADRELAAREALARVRQSRRVCGPLYGPELAFGLYAAGDCTKGAKASREISAIRARMLRLLPYRPEL